VPTALFKRALSISAGKRILGAFSVAIALLIASAVVASLSYDKSRRYSETARNERTSNLAASNALGAFWRERESMNEYLLTRTAADRAEVRSRQAAFDRQIGLVPAGSTLERGYLTQARWANNLLLAYLPSRLDEAAARRVILQLKSAEVLATSPLTELIRVSERHYLHREDVARDASRRALEIEVGSALLALCALSWFAFVAVRLVKRVDRANDQLQSADRAKDELAQSSSGASSSCSTRWEARSRTGCSPTCTIAAFP
jgi:hypothetical protein